jgi:hypothetical protein
MEGSLPRRHSVVGRDGGGFEDGESGEHFIIALAGNAEKVELCDWRARVTLPAAGLYNMLFRKYF